MDNSLKFLIGFAVVIVFFYSIFEIYSSIIGAYVKFDKVITPINPDLGQPALTHIEKTSDRLLYDK